ncbi:MAG: hypothetical protein IJ877_04230 [Candidatus Gastranaerophilales bacterium]|nr:hypothetical protein [Candidatus Gastranaerophilales bacterium]
MRILILGNDYSAQSFFELFNQNKNNIVFSTLRNSNYTDFQGIDDILEFIKANDINFVLITQEDYINSGLSELISAQNVTVFSPSSEAIAITCSKAYAKKFMYKNKIPTARFQIFEKPQQALDYVNILENPIAIKPDNHNNKECTQFCETALKAKKVINDLFANDNKKIIIEDYIEGKNIEVFVLSDGFKFQILGISAKYQNNVAYFEPEFLNDEIVDNIIQNAIIPTIDTLCNQGDEYIGILGFDIILKSDNSFVMTGYNSFFDDIDVDFYTKGFNIDWLGIFESTVIGDVFSKFEINPKNEYMLSLRQDDKINFISAKTMSNLELYLEELYDTKEYFEAVKIWKS